MADDDKDMDRVEMRDGKPVLIPGPSTQGFIKAVERHNCRLTFEHQAERVQHFKRRIAERGDSPNDVVIVLLNVNDPHGRVLADMTMPGQDAMWQSMRDQGQVPFARGLATRQGITEAVMLIDDEIGEKLKAMKDKAVVVVVDHGVVEVFEV